MNLTPAGYDPTHAAAVRRAILQLHAVCVQAPTAEGKLLSLRDAAGHMLSIALGEAKQAGAAGDPRARLAALDILDALAAVVAVRARYETGDELEVAA